MTSHPKWSTLGGALTFLCALDDVIIRRRMTSARFGEPLRQSVTAPLQQCGVGRYR